jgi:predicted RNA-binding protein Jag
MTLENEGKHGQEGHPSTKGQQKNPASRVRNSGEARKIPEQNTDLTISMGELTPILMEVLDMREVGFSDKITQRISDKYDEIIGSMEQRLKDQFAETSQTELKSELEDTVEEAVENFMRHMLVSGSSYEREMRFFVSRIVDERLTGELGSLIGSLNIFPNNKMVAGQADTRMKSARLSATIRQETYDRIKTLGGIFSNHIQAACELYLKALEGRKNFTHME